MINNKREMKISRILSAKDDCYAGYLSEQTKPIIESIINNLTKKFVKSLKKELKNTKNEEGKKSLLGLIEHYEVKPPAEIVHVADEVEIIPPKKVESKPLDKNIFKPVQPLRSSSRMIYWCDARSPINVGKLGSSQAWRFDKPPKTYY
jgi:hypothetical protein